jgi:hypothetical protein
MLPGARLFKHWLACLVAVFLLMTSSGCCLFNKAPDFTMDETVVDIHSHLFNSRDFPNRGILSALGLPDGVADSVAIVIESWTRLDEVVDPTFREAIVASKPTSDPKTLAPVIRPIVRIFPNSRSWAC